MKTHDMFETESIWTFPSSETTSNQNPIWLENGRFPENFLQIQSQKKICFGICSDFIQTAEIRSVDAGRQEDCR